MNLAFYFLIQLHYVLLQPNLSEILSYCTTLCTRLLQNKGLREDILRLLVRLHSNLDAESSLATTQPDYINICQCLIYLDDPVSVSEILRKLLKEDKVGFILEKFICINCLHKRRKLWGQHDVYGLIQRTYKYKFPLGENYKIALAAA